MKMGCAQTKPKKKPISQTWKQRSSGSKQSFYEASSGNDKTGAGKKKITTPKACTEKVFNVKLENRFLALDLETSS